MGRLKAITELSFPDTEFLKEFQEGLWEWLFGEFQLFKHYRNPLREDKDAGCQFYYDSKGNLRFNDFAGKNYTLVDYCTDKFKITRRAALEALQEQIKYLSGDKPTIQGNVIDDFSGLFTPNISKDNTFFNFGEVDHIKKLSGYVYNGVIHKYEHSYLYTTPDGGQKIYNPYVKENKWKIVSKSNMVDGEWLLDFSYEYLIITTSRKDSVTLRALGYANVVNPYGSEKETINIPYLISKYHLNLKKVWIIADNDDTGKREAAKYKVPIVHMPNGIKDPYELYEVNPLYLKKWLKKFLKLPK